MMLSTTALSEPKLSLSSNVFACPTKHHWVFLDVDRDAYVCVERDQFDALGPSLNGWFLYAGRPAEHDPSIQEAAQLRNDLVARGLLTADGTKPVCPVPYEPVRRDLTSSFDRRSVASSLAHLPAFWAAARRADRMLSGTTKQSLKSIVARLRNRASSPTHPQAKLLSLVSAFASLRHLYPKPYLCLFESLALVEFFWSHSIRVSWVFGVKTDPFYAHCWVQDADVLLNDSAGNVALYAPIMVV